MNKTERLSIKILPADKALLVRIAQAEGESVAVIVRRLVRRAARELGLSQGHAAAKDPNEENQDAHSSPVS